MRGKLEIDGEEFEVVVNNFEISRDSLPIVGISVVSNIDKFNDMAIKSVSMIEFPFNVRMPVKF